MFLNNEKPRADISLTIPGGLKLSEVLFFFFFFADMSWLPLLFLSEKSKIKDTHQPANKRTALFNFVFGVQRKKKIWRGIFLNEQTSKTLLFFVHNHGGILTESENTDT